MISFIHLIFYTIIQIQHMTIQSFTFPLSTDELQQIKGKQDLKQLLLSTQKDIAVHYSIKVVREHYIYARCGKCCSKLKYKKLKNSDTYQLVSFSNSHRHMNQRGQHNLLKKKIAELPYEVRAITAFQMLRKEFILSRATFYRVYNQVRYQDVPIPSLFNSFSQHKFVGHYEPLDVVMPSLIILTNQDMKKSFHLYGEFCTFDLTYHLVRERSWRDRKYAVGFIVGLNNHTKITPYAIVVTDDQTKQTMAKTFYEFFKIMNKKPKTIITDEQLSIAAGLDILAYEDLWDGSHLHDSFHVLRNIRNKLKTKENIRFFKQVIKAQNEAEFQQKLVQLETELKYKEQQGIIDKLIQNSQKYCFAKIPNNFIGFSVSSSICQKTNDLIKSRVPFSIKLSALIIKSHELCIDLTQKSKLCNRETGNLERMFQFEELKSLKNHLCKKVFLEVARNISRTIFTLLRSENSSTFIINDSHGEFRVKIKAQPMKTIECSCQYSQKTGLPCLHVLKVGLLKDFKVIDLISKRWISTEDKMQAFKNNTQKHFKTRRNKK